MITSALRSAPHTAYCTCFRNRFTMVANLMNIHLRRESQVSVEKLMGQLIPPDEDEIVRDRRAFFKELTPEQRERVKKYGTNNS